MPIAGVPLEATAGQVGAGGVGVAGPDTPPGSLVDQAGQLQYGRILLGVGTRAGWRKLTGWRGAEGEASDAPRPLAHGTYPGDVYAPGKVVTFDALVTGTPESKLAALDTIETHTRVDGVERALVVDDGTGPWLRYGRVVAREVPQELHFRHGPVKVSVQWLCADPRRYSVRAVSVLLGVPSADGGLVYDPGLDYAPGLDYGTYDSGTAVATNAGSADTPPIITLRGPLLQPSIRGAGWLLEFGINLVAGESLVVDTQAGTALLNGTTDRLYTITPRSDPIEACLLPPGATSLELVAESGTGNASVAFRHARM